MSIYVKLIKYIISELNSQSNLHETKLINNISVSAKLMLRYGNTFVQF